MGQGHSYEKMVYGISDITCGSSAERPLYGPGQGSTCGPLFWLLCYWVVVESLDPTIGAAKFYSVCKSAIKDITGVSFVDNTSLCTTYDYETDPTLLDEANREAAIQHKVCNLSHLAKHWERLLFTTGGGINFKKNHWYLMTWMWKKGIPKLATTTESPSNLTLTTGYSKMAEEVPRHPCVLYIGSLYLPLKKPNAANQDPTLTYPALLRRGLSINVYSRGAYLSYMTYLSKDDIPSIMLHAHTNTV
jgi:hypothetical protein